MTSNAAYLALPVGVVAVLAGFAGGTDLRPVRWLHLGVAVLLLSGVALLGWFLGPEAFRVPLPAVAALGWPSPWCSRS